METYTIIISIVLYIFGIVFVNDRINSNKDPLPIITIIFLWWLMFIVFLLMFGVMNVFRKDWNDVDL